MIRVCETMTLYIFNIFYLSTIKGFHLMKQFVFPSIFREIE
jgi:hypothetical protein